MAGEVKRLKRTLPTAVLATGLKTALGYLLPLIAGTKALDVSHNALGAGYFADAAVDDVDFIE
ncbi:putative polyamine transporter [Canna indica]|uniref:Polyamine transporter n=1 Tax=Canna indica TaxID=4628 RepID=A0AAQ3KAZ1_9LILI|nr:putative polyamine transporter [Canna indica]